MELQQASHMISWCLTTDITLNSYNQASWEDADRKTKLSLTFCSFDRSVRPSISTVMANPTIFLFCSCLLLKHIISCKAPFFFLSFFFPVLFPLAPYIILLSYSHLKAHPHPPISDCAKDCAPTQLSDVLLQFWTLSPGFCSSHGSNYPIPPPHSHSRWFQHCDEWGTVRRTRLWSDILSDHSPCQ